MKKIIHRFTIILGSSFFLFLILAMPNRHTEAANNSIKTFGDYTYKVYNIDGQQNVSLVSYNGTEEDVVIPETINSIKVTTVMENYKNPDKIKTITLSRYITGADYRFFKDLKNLEAIKVDKNNSFFYDKDGILFSHYKKNINLVFYPINKAGSIYQIPKEVTHANFAFINNRCLKTLVINNSTNTTYSSMAENSNIETIIIPDKIKFIGEQSFEKCKKLKKVVIGKDVTKICDEAFYDCTSLETIVLPNKLERIDRWAFKNCKALKKLSIPSSVHYIDPLAFEGCKPSIRREAYLKKQKNGSYIAKANVTANGKKKEYKAKNITKITTSDKKITLKKGKQKKIKTTVYISGKKKGILDYNLLKYASSNNKVVKVTSHGNIKALKKGKATIKVTLKNKNISYKITVKVK